MTTNAVVSASAFSNAASTALLIFASSSSVGNGVFGSRSPIGQSWALADGRFADTVFGVNDSVDDPSGYVTQPWLPV